VYQLSAQVVNGLHPTVGWQRSEQRVLIDLDVVIAASSHPQHRSVILGTELLRLVAA
jgi:hypothetical protein